MGYEDYLVIAGLQATNSSCIDAAVSWIIDNGYKIPRPAPIYQPKKVVKPIQVADPAPSEVIIDEKVRITG